MRLFNKPKKYRKEEDPVYIGLLRLACVSDFTEYNDKALNEAIEILNQLPYYSKVHWRLLPLLNAKAKKLNVFEKLKPDVQQLLKEETQKGIIRELAKEKQLKAIIDALTKENIPMILLKGTAFANDLYPKEAPRLSNDIDVLIKEEYWSKTIQTLGVLMSYSPKRQGFLAELTEISFKPRKKIGAALDLHKSISYPVIFNIDNDIIWKNSLTHPNFPDEQPLVSICSPEEAIVHQATHALVDINFCKYNLLDTHEIFSCYDPSLEEIITLSEEWGVRPALYFLLSSCVNVLGTNLDKRAIEKIKPSFLSVYFSRKITSSTSLNIQAKKTVRYKMIQFISHYIYTNKMVNTIRFHFLYIKQVIASSVIRFKNCITNNNENSTGRDFH